MWRGLEHITVGEYTYGDIQPKGSLFPLTIGKFCSIGQNCIIDLGMGHNLSSVSTYPFNQKLPGCTHLKGHPTGKGPVHIGSDVWLGDSVTVLGGVTIGDGAVVGCNSTVTKNIGPYEVWGGCPAKYIRRRFSTDYIKRLLALGWWDKSEAEIKEIAPLLMSNKIDELLKLYNL